MEGDNYRYLKKFYDLLYENVQNSYKLINNSIILSFIKSREATRFSILNKSSISGTLIPQEILNYLILNNHIQSSTDINSYLISAKGIWFVENKENRISEENLIEYINETYFKLSEDYKLIDKEKVILLAMISARTFSEVSSVDLKKEEYIKNKWLEILEKSYDLLSRLEYIRSFKNKIIGRSHNVHIASSIFRHNNDMKKKTKDIYSFNRNQEYFLDLYRNNNLSKDKLSYLFYKIYGGNLNQIKIDEISNFCNNISKRESIFLFDVNEHIFSHPKYNKIIRDALIDSMRLKSKYERM